MMGISHHIVESVNRDRSTYVFEFTDQSAHLKPDGNGPCNIKRKLSHYDKRVLGGIQGLATDKGRMVGRN